MSTWITCEPSVNNNYSTNTDYGGCGLRSSASSPLLIDTITPPVTLSTKDSTYYSLLSHSGDDCCEPFDIVSMT